MVVFTCNNCGDSLQKPKVAKHYQFQCRNSISLTCVDCFKDFLGDAYVTHTKCITEAERYGSKDYVAKPSANKGEKKQQEWIKIVNNTLNNFKNLSKDERIVFQHISKYENIPRKKIKFLNFVKSSMGYRINMNTIESCWNKIEITSNEMANSNKSSEIKEGNDNNDSEMHNNGRSELNNINENKQMKMSPKKRKHAEVDVDENEIKQSKIKINDREIQCENNMPTDIKQVEKQVVNDESKAKFDWESCILHQLDNKGEMTLKKLEKRVVAKYLRRSENSSHDKATKRFHKKLSKISGIVVNNDMVKHTH